MDKLQGTVRLPSDGLIAEENSFSGKVLGFVGSVFRGVGQVMHQNNGYAGLLFLAGLFYNSGLFGTAVVVGTVVSTGSAILLGADASKVDDGLFASMELWLRLPLVLVV